MKHGNQANQSSPTAEHPNQNEEPRIRRTGKAPWEINGSLRVRELSDLIGRPVKETPTASTVCGLMIEKLGRFARPSDVFTLDGSELRVEEIAGTRITKIKLTRRNQAAGAVARNLGSLGNSTELGRPGSAASRRDHSRMEHAA